MIRLAKILVPIDFSEQSRSALEYGLALAEKFQADLHLLHVIDDYFLLAPEANLALPNRAEYRTDLIAKSTHDLSRLPDFEAALGSDVVRETRVGKPFVEIVRYAKEQTIDLIVMGTHGRSGLPHVLMGSVAENVVRKASCPVLAVRPGQYGFVMP